MTNRSVLTATYGLLAATSLIACNSHDPLIAPDRARDPAQVREAGVSQGAVRTLDDEYVEIANRVPGFGGMFVDSSGKATIYLVDPARQSAVTDAVRAVLRDKRPTWTSEEVIRGAYDFRDLKSWQKLLHTGLKRNKIAITLTDVDDARNRIRVGVASAEDAARAASLISQMNVPEGAVIVEVIRPFELQVTLRQRIRSIVAGSQLDIAGPGGECTLGFNAIPGGTSGGTYAVTASHCTTQQGVVSGIQFYQAVGGVGNDLVNYEIIDPDFFTGNGCPDGRLCRYSDAALLQYYSGMSAYIGYTARTTQRGAINNITLASDNGGLTYIQNENNKNGTPPFGATLDKVGRTTGWTTGPLSSACVMVDAYQNGFDTGRTFICQNIVNAVSGSGDSGSPVFSYSPNSYGGAYELRGILWSGNGTSFAYSPIESVLSELSAGLANAGMNSCIRIGYNDYNCF